jgi:hypothetical protein
MHIYVSGSVVSWSEFLAADTDVPVRIPGPPYFLSSSGFETGPLSLVSINDELFERKSSGSGLEN